MASRRLNIEFMSRTYSIFESIQKIFHHFFTIFTLKDKQIFYTKLFIFVPPESKPTDIGTDSFGVEGGRIEEIKYFFVINLEKRN